MKIEKMSVKCLALYIPHSPSKGGQMIYVKSLVKLVYALASNLGVSAASDTWGGRVMNELLSLPD